MRKINHILIIRLSAMGDVAMTSPVVRSFRERYPEIKITILTPAFLKPFFRDVENADFFCPDFKGRHKGLPGVVRLFFDIIKTGKIDAVADLHDVLRTKILRLCFAFTSARIAKINKRRKDNKALVSGKIKQQLTPVVEKYCEVFSKLGLPVEVPKRANNVNCAIPDVFKDVFQGNDYKYIGVAPFAQHYGKVYPYEKVVELVGKLSAKGNVCVFLFGGGEKEKNLVEKLTERFSNVYSVIGKIKLNEELDLISNLDCMISMDSSAMHMSSLVGVDVVSVWGATHPYSGFLGLGQSMDLVVHKDMNCRPCSVYGNKKCRRKDYACMYYIGTEDILEKVSKIIS